MTQNKILVVDNYFLISEQNFASEYDMLRGGVFVFLGFSAVTTTLSWIYYYRAIKMGDVSVVAVIDKASIVITLILSFWLLKEPFTWRMGLAAALIISGLLVLTIK